MQVRRTTGRQRIMAIGGVLLATAMIAAGCGGDDESSDDTDTATTTTQSTSEDTSGEDGASGETESTGGGTELDLGVEQGELKFDKTELTAPAGKVTIKFDNPDSIPHNVAVKDGEDVKGESELISKDTVELTVDLEPGEYEFYCTPHEGAGMKGTLTIT